MGLALASGDIGFGTLTETRCARRQHGIDAQRVETLRKPFGTMMRQE